MPVARQQPPSAASANSSRNAEPVSVVNTGSHRASARARNSPTAQHTRDESDTESDTSASGPEPMPKTKTPYGSALRFIRQHVFLIGAFVVSALLASLTAYSYFNGQPDTPNCAMSYSRPRFLEQTSFGKSWTRFSTKYKLYLYREGGFDVYDEPYRIPVLFVPGNAGSPKQVRSIASATTTAFIEMVGRDKKVLGQGKIGYDFFSVGLNEEFTALHGYSIMEQAEFINDAIRYILSQYPRTRKRHDLGVPGAALPQSVVVVGHSMGGVVARTAFTLPNHIVGSVQAIFTLATPHSNPTASLEYYVDKVYGEINRFWRHGFHNGTLDNVSLVSIAGGNLDSMINSDYTFVGNLAPSKNSLSILSSGIEDVWLSLDHQSILWCRQMARKFAAMLVGIMDVRRPSQLLPLDVRMGYMRDTLYSALDRGAADTMGVSRRIVNGTGFGFMKVHDEGAVRVLMPDKNADSAKKSLHLVSLDRMAIDGPESVLQVISYAKKPRSQQDIGEGTASKLVFNIYGCTNPNSESDGTTSASEGLSKISCEYIHPLTAPAKLPLKAPDLDPERPVPLLEYFEVPLGHILETQKLNYIGVELPAEQAKHTGFLYVNVATKSDPIVHSPGILHLLLGSYTIGVPGSAKDTTLSTRTRIKLDVPENPFFVFRAKITMNRRRLQTTSGKPKFSTIIRQSDGRREFESKFWYDTQELDLAIHGRGAYLPSDDLANAAKENDLDTENLWDGIYIDLWADREYYSGASIKLSINWYSSLNRMVKRYDMALLALSFVWACLVVLHQLRVWNAEKVTVDKSVFPSCLASIEHLVRHGTLATLMVVAVATPVVQLTVGYLMQDLWSPKTLAAWNNLFMGVQGTGLMVCVVPALMVIVSLGFVTFEALVLTAICHLASWVISTVFMYLWKSNQAQRVEATIIAATTATVPTSGPKTPALTRPLIATVAFVVFVCTFVPYQFAFLVIYIAQLITSVRTLVQTHQASLAMRTLQQGSISKSKLLSVTTMLSNRAQYQLTLLFFWTSSLPYCAPELLVWVRNLSVMWFEDAPSDHNLMNMAGYFALRMLASYHILPRFSKSNGKNIKFSGVWMRLTTFVLFGGAVLVAWLWCVRRPYVLYNVANAISAWLAVVQFAEFWRNGVIGETHTVLSIVDVDDTRQSEMVGVGGGTGDPVDEYPLLDIRRR